MKQKVIAYVQVYWFPLLAGILGILLDILYPFVP
jgi:hypothetical protein